MSEHHSHAPSHEFRPAFPADAENYLLECARRVPETAATSLTLEELQKIEETYDIVAIRERVYQHFPTLSATEYAAVVEQFASGYESLPKNHPRYEHGHHHAHDHDHSHEHSCGKIHGPIRRRLEALEESVLGRITNRRAQVVAAASFRLMALTFCPGDDLAAIGLQVYGAVSGKASGGDTHGHTHTAEHLAVLPRRPRQDFVDLDSNTARISVPLDTPVAHHDLPATASGDAVREIIADLGEAQQAAHQARLAHEATEKPAKRRRRRRFAAIGATALALLGIGSANAPAEAPKPVAIERSWAPAPDYAPLPDPKPVQQPPRTTKQAKIRPGDSQWSLTEKQFNGHATNREVHAATLYTGYLNQQLYPNPNRINSGERLTIPTHFVTEQFQAALQPQPEAQLTPLERDIRLLSVQAKLYSEPSQQVLERIHKAFAN